MFEEIAGYQVKPKNNIQNALEVLKQATLRVLYEDYISEGRRTQGLTFNDIHEALSIKRVPNTKDYFVHGILLRLWQEDGHAERIGYGRWHTHTGRHNSY